VFLSVPIVQHHKISWTHTFHTYFPRFGLPYQGLYFNL
jgi:hypothetical protein